MQGKVGNKTDQEQGSSEFHEKITFYEALKNPSKNVTTKLEEQGGKSLVTGPLKKKITFFAAFIIELADHVLYIHRLLLINLIMVL